ILSRPVVNADLQQFRQEFYQRYGDAEVPLALALDPDWGIGYASPGGQSAESSVFIDDLHAGKRKSAPKLQADAIQELVLRKYIACLENGEDCITLSVTDLQSAAGLSKEAVYSQSMYVIGSLLKNGPGEQDYCFDLQNLWGPSAANLFSRFTYRNEELHRLTTAMLQAEEERSPDTIFAEIVHLPEARVGNILLRPHLRRYEIPYMGKSGLDDAHQLPLDDLLVSVHHNEIILRSKKHGKRVIPRLASAHNFDTPRSLPLYRFLCDLQTQGLYGPAFWDWGLLSQVKHLPRVVFKKLLLKKACWQFDEKDLAILGKDQQRIKSQLPAFRAKWKLPRKISVVEREDHELYIDLESSAGLDLLADLLKKSKSLHIEEFLFNEEHAFVKDVNGDPYSNEVIIPVTVSAAMQYNSDLTATPSVSGIKRNFFPGSEWLYFKIYCGTKYAEKILRNLILDFVEEASQQAGFDKFFFIRYHDTASHIRIRFYNEDISRQVTLQQRFLSLLETQRQTGLIHDMSIHAYTRELERYGEKTMSHIESLFYHDSLTVLRLLRLLGEVEDAEEYRMLFALRGIHMFLDDFGLSLTDKYALIKEMQLNYFREFGGKPALQKQLNDKYRTWQRKIASHMNPDEDEDNGIEEATTLFAERSVLSLPVINDIYHVYAATHLDSKQEVMKILDSCIHMFLNRLFVSRQRKFELVAYHFMERYYYSRQVIEKQKKEKELVKQS
ncbi:MAG TPA: lantibiotic dehydratase, partial [Chitinophaga sp.]|uniref:lantibiotic dehydratase n=1 Tax=Chitinophaga sp. TaxID=1869181 RepID=UPI002C5DCE72